LKLIKPIKLNLTIYTYPLLNIALKIVKHLINKKS
jgi:hypothetical protein